MKKELIKNIIKPFFKKEGFSNKGVNFYKDLGEFELYADLQSQRYYKEENTQNFRINFKLLIKKFTQMTGKTFGVYGGFVPIKGSWIEISPTTDYQEVASWLSNELESVYQKIIQHADLQKLADLYKDDIFHLYHLYFFEEIIVFCIYILLLNFHLPLSKPRFHFQLQRLYQILLNLRGYCPCPLYKYN